MSDDQKQSCLKTKWKMSKFNVEILQDNQTSNIGFANFANQRQKLHSAQTQKTSHSLSHQSNNHNTTKLQSSNLKQMSIIHETGEFNTQVSFTNMQTQKKTQIVNRINIKIEANIIQKPKNINLLFQQFVKQASQHPQITQPRQLENFIDEYLKKRQTSINENKQFKQDKDNQEKSDFPLQAFALPIRLVSENSQRHASVEKQIDFLKQQNFLRIKNYSNSKALKDNKKRNFKSWQKQNGKHNHTEEIQESNNLDPLQIQSFELFSSQKKIHSNSLYNIFEEENCNQIIQQDDEQNNNQRNTNQSAQINSSKLRALKNKFTDFNSIKKNLTFEAEQQLIFEIKLCSLLDFGFTINLSNQILQEYKKSTSYNAIISKGNNGCLIRNCLKQRWWWNIVDKDFGLENIDFWWTQWSRKDFFEIEKTKQIKKIQKQQVMENNETKIEKPKQLDVNKKENQVIQIVGKTRYQQWQQNDNYQIGRQNIILSQIKKGEYLQGFNPLFIDQNGVHDSNVFGSVFSLFCNEGIQIPGHTHNHLSNHFQLSNKKALFINLKNYYSYLQKDPFQYIPLTFDDINEFKVVYNQRAEQDMTSNIWIIKPGEDSNRGNGITITNNINEIEKIMTGKSKHSYLIQEYITKPFLYYKRKFDIRCYMLITSVQTKIKAYWYQDGYIRTSCKEFTIKNLENRYIHLTNDAVQKNSENYGKFEGNNKLLFSDFQKYLDLQENKFNFQSILPTIKSLALDAVKSVYMKIDPNQKGYCFELFGLDFMVDSNFKPWLIEINTNPCLEVSGCVLSKIIPPLVENMLKLGLDPIFPPPLHWPRQKRSQLRECQWENNKFELIFDELLERDENLVNEMNKRQVEVEQNEQCEDL